MQQNQTARELAHEYEQMAIAATNDYCNLKRYKAFGEFPALVSHIEFCTTMYILWRRVNKKLTEGPEMYESESDWTVEDYYGEYGV